MDTVTPVIRTFFERYARSRTARDVELIAYQYSDSFMFADPNGVRVVEKAVLLTTWPKGFEFLRSQGHQYTKLTSLNETRLDEHYLLVRALLVWHFEKPAEQPIDIEVDSSFIVYAHQGAFTIVFQQEREDFQGTLRSHGILPPAP
jgi:hypothetical protein